jgi:hypothetical protein
LAKKDSLMRFLKFVLGHLKIFGYTFLLMGFFLIPFIIGVPIFIAGIALLVFNFHKEWIFFLVPEAIRKQIGNDIIESYAPYQPAIKSMKSVGKDIAKTSAIVFVVLIAIAAIILYIRFGLGGPEDSWLCDKNGNWIKHGNPSYPSPVVSCDNKVLLPNNKDDCLARNGIWQKQGPEPFESCNRKAVDRGNLCRDNSECEGICQVELTKDEMSQGMRGNLNIEKKYGQCSVWVVELGCSGIMKQGKAEVICID